MRGALSGSVLGHASTSGASVSSTSSLHNLHHHAPRSPPHTASTRLHPRPLPAAPHAVMEPPVAPLSLAVAEPSQQGPQHLQQFVVSGTPPPSQQQQHHHQHDNGGCMLELLELEAGAPLSNAALLPPPKPVVLVISGPSGVGKDAVVHMLKASRPDLYFVVTATSRPMRPNEVEGRDYFFVDRPKFEQWIRDDMLLEHALVYGDYKGIPRQQVDDALKAGTDVVLRVDVQGAATVKRLMPDAVTVFVAAESERSLAGRLAARRTEGRDAFALRMSTARAEMERAHEFDYVVVNGTGMLEQCVAQLGCIITAEKARSSNRLGRQQREKQQEQRRDGSAPGGGQ